MLTVAGAVRALPLRDADARAWLIDNGLIVDLAGRPRVIWGQVLDALAETAPARAPARRRPSARCDVAAGGEDGTGMGAKWPRKVVVGDVQAAPMRPRGRRDDGRVYWRARRTIGGKQVAISLTEYLPSGSGWGTRREVERAIIQALHDGPGARPGRGNPQHALTIGELVDEWLEHREFAGGLRPRTMRQYRSTGKMLKERIGDMRAVDLTTAEIERYARRRVDAGHSGASLRNDFAVLRQAMAWGVKTALIPSTATPTFIKVHYEPKRRSRPPERRVLRKAFAWLKANRPEMYRVLRLQALLGARIGEVWALRWRDIEFADGATTVAIPEEGKTGARRVPASAAAVELLDELRALYPSTPGAKVIGPVAGPAASGLSSRISTTFDGMPWKKWGERWRPNDLRALTANELIRSGVSIPDYEAIMGHRFDTARIAYWTGEEAQMRKAMNRADIASELEVAVVSISGVRAQEE